MTLLRIELFDDRSKLLNSWEHKIPQMGEKMNGIGVGKFYEFDPTEESSPSWRLVIDFVHIALPGPFAVTTTDHRRQPPAADQPKLRSQEEDSQLFDSEKESDVTSQDMMSDESHSMEQ